MYKRYKSHHWISVGYSSKWNLFPIFINVVFRATHTSSVHVSFDFIDFMLRWFQSWYRTNTRSDISLEDLTVHVIVVELKRLTELYNECPTLSLKDFRRSDGVGVWGVGVGGTFVPDFLCRNRLCHLRLGTTLSKKFWICHCCFRKSRTILFIAADTIKFDNSSN